MSKRNFVVRVIHGNCNNTYRVSESTLRAMLDLLTAELHKGRIRAFSVEGA